MPILAAGLFFNSKIREMTTSERKALQRDLSNPQHLFTLIVENNPEGVSNQMQSWGWSYSDSSPEQMIEELMKAWNSGGQVRQQAIKLVSNVQYRFGVFPSGFDQVITGQAPQPMLQTTDGQGAEGNWYSDIDWGGIIGAIGGIVTDATGGGSNGWTPEGPNSTPGAAPGVDDAEDSEGSKKTMQWVAVGAAVLIIIVALVIAMRK